MPVRRPATPATIVMIVAVGAFAVGLAGTGTYLVVSRYLQEKSVAAPEQTPPVDPATTTPEQPCPQFTIDRVQAAGRPGNLVQVLHVQGTKSNGEQGEAWICRDSDGTLYYQGHDKDGEPLVEGENTIIVGGGINGAVSQDGSTYIATVSFGSYRVSPSEFRLIGNDGAETVWIMN